MLTDLQNVDALIKAYEDAIAHHNKIFEEDAPQAECAAALDPANDALIAICAARPATPEGRRRRREYLSERLFEDTDGCADLIKAAFAALLEDPMENPEGSQ